MITLIHGDDIKESRNYFIEQKKLKKASSTLSGENVNFSAFTQVLEGGGIFGSNKTIFIEDLFNKKRPGKEFESIINLLNSHDSFDIILWEGKILTPKQISLLSKTAIKIFKLPQAIFNLLDNLRPNNEKSLITLFHQALKNSDEGFIFYMLIHQFRLLLALSVASDLRGREAVDLVGPSKLPDSIDEIIRLAPWRKNKLEKQAKLFSFEQLKKIYNKLYEIDLSQKTGALNLTLVQSIDFLLLEI